MKWITATNLEDWGRTNSAEPELPELVADLISATATDIRSIRFPGGDKGRTRGLDGILESDGDALFVPAGKSIWEIGTEIDYKGKALGDFLKRSGEISPADQEEITLVLVTPFTWDSTKKEWKLENWVEARKKEQTWKNVVVIDGASLEHWLAEAPAVAAWHARNTLKIAPVEAVRSTDEFWNDFANRFSPPLIEEVLTTERESTVEQLLGVLMGPPDQISLIGDAPDEVVAFAVASIRSADASVRKFLEARTLVIDTEAGGRGLVLKSNLAFLLRGDAARSPGKFSEAGPTLVPLGGWQRSVNGLPLARQTSFALARALENMKLPERQAQILARGCGGSLAALERQIPGGASEPPEWYDEAAILLPAFLAGSWDAENAHDQEVMAAIAGTSDYATFEKTIRPFTARAGSPIAREKSIFKVRAPLDAFIHSGNLIGMDTLASLRPVFVRIFSHIDPEADPDEPAYMRKPPNRHSEWLRDGLAATLLLIAIWERQAQLAIAPGAGQAFADDVVASLPGLRTNSRLLTSLGNGLPMLAEAAPEPFLSALELMLEGAGELIRPIFDEVKGFAFPTSNHTDVLWAVERLAWDPKLFRRACLVLAGLDKVDPGGRLGNRPSTSLTNIFMLWLPSTFAGLPLRLAVLEEIIVQHPVTGWKLLLQLLPDEQTTSSGTDEPRLRGFDVERSRGVTNAELWESQMRVCERAIELATGDPEKMMQLLRPIFQFPSQSLDLAIIALEKTLKDTDPMNREALWVHLNNEVKRHRRFSHTDWALNGEQIDKLEAISAEFAPQNSVLKVISLFDDYSILGDEIAHSQLRTDAVMKLAADGTAPIVELITKTRASHHVMWAISEAKLPEPFLAQLVRDNFSRDPNDRHLGSILEIFRQAAGNEHAISLIADLNQSADSGIDIASLLCAMPSEPWLWQAVSSFGEAIETEYWRKLRPLWTKAKRPVLLRLMIKLARHGRPIAALETGHNRLKEVPSCMLLGLLDRSHIELNKMDSELFTVNLDYEIETVFKELDRRDLSDLEVARREYALLPFIDRSKRPLRLHRLMASDADFFHEVLRNVYKEDTYLTRADSPDSDAIATDSKRALWRQSYKLLKGFTHVPGFDDQEPHVFNLTNWIDRMRQLAVEHDRRISTELALGSVLAHAPDDDVDGGWPHRFVRDQIERLSSNDLERGLQIERFNMRGVTVRGMRDGGRLERELATDYRQWAATSERWPRTSSLLSRIAERWDQDAEREDSEVRKRDLRDTF